MALRELLAEFGIQVDDKQLNRANEKLDSFVDRVQKVGGAVLGAFAVRQIYQFAEGVAHTIDQIDDTATALGISAEAVQTWGFMADAAGDSGEELLNMMGRLQVQAANTKDATSGAGKAFAELKVKTHDANGRIKEADQLMSDVAEAIAEVKDPAKQAGLAVEIFGRQGRQLLPFLKGGSAGINQMKKEFKELGGGFDAEAIEKGGEFQHQMARVKVMVDGIKNAMVKGLFPVLSFVADKAATIGGWFARMTKNTDLFRNALVVLGIYLTPLALEMAAAFAPVLLAGAALAGIVILVDDIITMFQGGKSVIGETLDKLFGKGTSANVVREVKDAWVEVKQAFVDMWPYVKQVYEALKWIVEHTVQVSGAIGDKLGRDRNREIEQTARETGAIKRGRGGLTFEQNATGENARSYLEALNRGDDMSKWQPPNLAKGISRDDVVEAVQKWIPLIQTDARYAQFQPQTYGPTPQPPAEGDIHVTVQGSTNMAEHELKRAVRDGVRDAKQQSNRAAKYNLSQAGQKQ